MSSKDSYENTYYYNKYGRHVIMKSPVSIFKESETPSEAAFLKLRYFKSIVLIRIKYVIPTVSWNALSDR